MAPTPKKAKASPRGQQEKSESGLQSPARKALRSPKGSSKKDEAKAKQQEEDQQRIMAAVKEAVGKRGEAGLALLRAYPKGVNVNGVDRDDMTAACWVLNREIGKSEEHLVNILRLLHERGADMTLAKGDGNEEWAPIHYAARKMHAAAVLPLVREMGADPSQVNEWGDTPLHTLLRDIGHLNSADALETVKKLVEAGADLRVQNKMGDNVLHLAGHKKATAPVIEALVQGALRQGCAAEVLAQRNLKGECAGDTPFLSLMRNGRFSSAFARSRGLGRGGRFYYAGYFFEAANPVELYLDSGAEWEAVNEGHGRWRGYNALHIAVAELDQAMVMTLLEMDESGAHGPKYALLRAAGYWAVDIAQAAHVPTKEGMRANILAALEAHKKRAVNALEGKDDAASAAGGSVKKEAKAEAAAAASKPRANKAAASSSKSASASVVVGGGKKRKAPAAASAAASAGGGGGRSVKVEEVAEEEEETARPPKKEKKSKGTGAKTRADSGGGSGGAAAASSSASSKQPKEKDKDKKKKRAREEEEEEDKEEEGEDKGPRKQQRDWEQEERKLSASAASAKAKPVPAADDDASESSTQPPPSQQEEAVATTSPPAESVDEGKAAARAKRPRAAAASASMAAAAAASSSAKGKGGDGGGGGGGANQAVRMRASAQADLKAAQAENMKRLREQECEKMGRFTPKLEAVAAKYRELVAEWRAAPAEPDGSGRVTRAGVKVEVDKYWERGEQIQMWLTFWVGVAALALKQERLSGADRERFERAKAPAQRALKAWKAAEAEGAVTREES